MLNLTFEIGGVVGGGDSANYSFVNDQVDAHQFHDAVPGFINGTVGWNDSSDPFLSLFETSTTGCGSLDNSSCLDNLTDPNSTANGTVDWVNPVPLWQIGFLGFLAGLTSIVTILGNFVVVLSFVLERAIRQPTNYFIASLAVSDLLLGSISMPFYTVYLLAGQRWPLGWFLCDLWLSIDYTVCLTSIYTVFCITIDRFCMVKIPAKYRAWRTKRKVLIMISCTWLIPSLVFFVTIFGWQFFSSKGRTVKPGQCYVQYMEDALFNCILQVSYFWITLTVMIVLYTGIYKVALGLQKKSETRRTKMTSLVSMAGQTMTKIGIGMSQQSAVPPGGKKSTHSKHNSSKSVVCELTTNQCDSEVTTLTTMNSARPVSEKDDDRSSSPAYPSDTDPSSQSPKRNSPNPMYKPKRDGHKKSRTKSKKNLEVEVATQPIRLQAPPKGKFGRKQRLSLAAGSKEANCVAGVGEVAARKASIVCKRNGRAGSPPNGNAGGQPRSQSGYENDALEGEHAKPAIDPADMYGGIFIGEIIEEKPPPPPQPEPPPPVPCTEAAAAAAAAAATAKAGSEEDQVKVSDEESVYAGGGGDTSHSKAADLDTMDSGLMGVLSSKPGLAAPMEAGPGLTGVNSDPGLAGVVTSEPELLAGVRYIDQESLKSLQSNDNLRMLVEGARASLSRIPDYCVGPAMDSTDLPGFSHMRDPDSPIWKPRPDAVTGAASEHALLVPPVSPPAATTPSPSACSFPSSPGPPPPYMDSMASTPRLAPGGATRHALSPADTQVQTLADRDSKAVCRLASTDEIQPLSGHLSRSSSSRKDKARGASPLSSFVKTVKRSKRRKKEGGSVTSQAQKEKQKSKSENRARKALRTITIILGAFVFCWTPWHILSMIISFCPNKETGCVEAVLYDISYWLCYLNSPINPFCYALANPLFKKTFVRIIRMDWHKT